MIHLGLGGFVFVCLSFVFFKPKNKKDVWAKFFVCFCSAVSLKHPSPKSSKNTENKFLFLSVFGWFFSFLQNQAGVWAWRFD